MPSNDLTAPAAWGFLITPVLCQDFGRLGRVVRVEKIDHASVDLVRDNAFEFQVTVSTEVHHLLVVEGRLTVVFFINQAGIFISPE